MFSYKGADPQTPTGSCEKSNLRSIYDKFQSFLSRSPGVTEDKITDLLSARSSAMASDDSFITPVSSVGDLMAMSPRNEHPDETSDLLTGAEFDSICDVTMQEVPGYDDNAFDATSIDYLVRCAESNRTHSHIDRGKESLFVKFDPLYAKKLNHSHSNLTESGGDCNDLDGGYETGSTASAFTDVATPKHSMSAGSVQIMNGKDKPTQVVPPVVNSETKIGINQTRSTPTLVRSVSAILPPTTVATDRLISISGTTPPTAAPRSPRFHTSYSSTQVDRLQSLRVILQKQDNQMLSLRQENIDLKTQLQDSEHRLSRTIELENRIKKLTEDKENLLERESKLLQQITDKNLSNKQMSIVMEEYEKTISSLISEQQREKIMNHQTIEKLTAERDQALNHLSNMESSFNDLLTKYEKCKSLILAVKDREKLYELKIVEYEDGLKKYEGLYNNLKQITSDNLAKANETLDNLKKSHSIEITKLNAVIKKHEITIASLQESVVQKTRDNEELTRICDQLINEVR